MKKSLLLNKIILFIVRLFAHTKTYKPKSLAVLKTDAIGDYVLFRNFLVPLKAHYKDYKITLISIKELKDLIEFLDSDKIDEIILIDRLKLIKNPFYLLATLWKLRRVGYEVMINAIYSKDTNNMVLAEAIIAKEKIAFSANDAVLPLEIINTHDRIYNHTINTSKEITFEFFRNIEFFSEILKMDLKELKPRISIDDKKKIDKIKSPLINQNNRSYILLFIGASTISRQWGSSGFIQVADYILDHTDLDLIICGGNSDIVRAETIEDALNESKKSKNLNNKIENLTGQTSLVEMLKIIKNAKMIISNETSIPHISVALGVDVLVIYNGNHLGRFTPYPTSLLEGKYLFAPHPSITKDIESYAKATQSYAQKSTLPIDEITGGGVIELLKPHL